MDADVEEVLVHLRGRVSNPAEFFEALRSVYEEHKEADFDQFRSAFQSKGFDTAGEELTGYLDDNGRFELLGKIVEERPESLAIAYAELDAADDGDDGDAESEVDSAEQDAAFKALLAQYSASWDGNEENWQAFEDYVRYYAGDAGLTAQAEVFFERARAEDKPALFAEYGVERPPAGGGAQAQDDAGAALWQQSIEQFGAAWADWDGSEPGWAEYRDWFYDATNAQDPAMYAAAYERMDPLNSLALEERIDRLREFGFDVAAPAAAGTEDATGAEQTYDRDSTFPWIGQVADALIDQWDGTDEAWPVFRESVAAAVRQQAEGRADLIAAGTGFLDEVEAAADKRAALAAFGVTPGGGEEEALAPAEVTETLQQVLDDADIDISRFSEEEVKEALEQALAEVSAEAN